MLNDVDEDQEPVCNRCNSKYCDGLKNCDICGEDTLCDKALCQRCEEQEKIEELMDDSGFTPEYYCGSW